MEELREAMKSPPLDSDPPAYSDDFLLIFLRTCKFDVHRAMTMLKTYVQYRRKHSDLFTNLTLESISGVLRSGVYRLLKEKDDDGRRVVVFKISSWNVSEYSLDDIQRAGAFLLDVLINEPEAQVHGLVIIDDLEACTWTHMWQFSVSKTERAMCMFRVSIPASWTVLSSRHSFALRSDKYT